MENSVKTIPGTADDYIRCEYQELCAECQEAIDKEFFGAEKTGAER